MARCTYGGRSLAFAIAAIWLVVVAAGMAMLADYGTTPGASAAAPRVWPEGTRLARDGDRPTLVMLAHPRCPCSRASIAELARLVAKTHGRLRTHVLFYEPAGAEEGWTHTDLRAAAMAIPGVQIHEDPGGDDARAFGASTSGQTLVYDADGRLVFSGGITDGRGHEGDNAGRDAIVAWLEGASHDGEAATTSVFGCSLHDPAEGGVRS
jgi:hypothetical protein